MANPTVFVEQFRGDVRMLLKTLDALRADRRAWDALDLGNVIQQSDIPAGTGITTAELAAAIGTTLVAIEALMAAGHATNLYRVT